MPRASELLLLLGTAHALARAPRPGRRWISCAPRVCSRVTRRSRPRRGGDEPGARARARRAQHALVRGERRDRRPARAVPRRVVRRGLGVVLRPRDGRREPGDDAARGRRGRPPAERAARAREHREQRRLRRRWASTGIRRRCPASSTRAQRDGFQLTGLSARATISGGPTCTCARPTAPASISCCQTTASFATAASRARECRPGFYWVPRPRVEWNHTEPPRLY